MSALGLLLAAEKSPAEEGRDVILVMLAVGLIFLSVIVLGQLLRYLEHKRKARRAAQRPY
jgi:heme/copper-type cytochrome/quinol oxidase subunit 2